MDSYVRDAEKDRWTTKKLVEKICADALDKPSLETKKECFTGVGTCCEYNKRKWNKADFMKERIF